MQEQEEGPCCNALNLDRVAFSLFVSFKVSIVVRIFCWVDSVGCARGWGAGVVGAGLANASLLGDRCYTAI